MDRKAIARETLEIMKQGYYELPVKNEAGQATEKKRIEIKEAMEQSTRRSILISPQEGEKILEASGRGNGAVFFFCVPCRSGSFQRTKLHKGFPGAKLPQCLIKGVRGARESR